MLTGLDVLVRENFAPLGKDRWGVLCNQASIDRGYRHILDLLPPERIAAVFGPQHGLFGHTQDNMIEWEAGTSRTRWRVHSLYGEHRAPTDAMLEGIDRFLVDLPDVGARYYTFIWTMAYCIEACGRHGIPVTVLDRPNPIGRAVEGPVLQSGFESFVGLHPLPIRHGMTIGEIAIYLRNRFYPSVELDVIELESWDSNAHLDETDAVWAMPSPNMPTVDTAVVYPGGCLLEATNLSEGRGTTRPFEILGAPFIDGHALAAGLRSYDLPGVVFRPLQFQPTFNKHAGRICEGVFVHVTDRRAFRPVATYLAVLREAQCQYPAVLPERGIEERFVANSSECEIPGFVFRNPPYEYEWERRPIDILAGNSWIREDILQGADLSDMCQRADDEARDFAGYREASLLYC